MVEKRKIRIFEQILVAVAVALLVGGTASRERLNWNSQMRLKSVQNSG